METYNDFGSMNESFLEGIGVTGGLIYAAFMLFYIYCNWKLYEKAGQPGWACIIPIYNLVVYLNIVNRPIWWIILLFIPVVNIVVGILLVFDLAKAFGKSTGFAIGLLLLSFVFIPILALGDSEYREIERLD